MSTNFFGAKKLKKYANKTGIIFSSGHEYYHGKGYRIHILENDLFSCAVLLKKNEILDIKKIPKNIFPYLRISSDNKLYMLT